MAINFKNALGVHPDMLLARSRRTEILANNIANADTPGYKSKDLDFGSVLADATSRSMKGVNRTHEKHFDLPTSINADSVYRVPDQPDTGDGNTVDVQKERNLFIENAMEYQASLTFLNGRFSGLKKALSGGR